MKLSDAFGTHLCHDVRLGGVRPRAQRARDLWDEVCDMRAHVSFAPPH